MHLSLNWLRRHIDLEGLTPEQIALDLTLSTAEVEGLERFLPHLDDVTVGFVKERVPHPEGLNTTDLLYLGGGVLIIAALAFFLIRRRPKAGRGRRTV